MQSEFISNASAFTRDSSVFSADLNVLLSVLSGEGGLVQCSRTAAWRVPLQLIKNSDNMIYGTHFAHKITGCNCLPDVFCACCFFLSASAGKHQRTQAPENSGSLSRGVHASVSQADEGIKMCYVSFISLYQPLGVHRRHKKHRCILLLLISNSMARRNISADERSNTIFFYLHLRKQTKKTSTIRFLWCTMQVIKVEAPIQHDLYISGDL